MALFPKTVLHPRYKPWLVAISRSGQTSETLQAVKTFRKAHPGQAIIAITCEAGSRLAKAADVVLVAQVQESGIVQTVSLSTLYLIGLQMIALWSKQTLQPDLAQHCAELLKQQQRLALEVGSNHDIKRFFFLGSGPLRGLASESRLKLKEMTLVQSEAFHTLEFRHGLGANVDSHSIVIALLAEKKSIYQHELGVLADMKAQGGHILTLGPMRLPTPPGVHIELGGSGLSLLPLYLPWIQLMAYYRALAVGRNPDQPTNLKAFIELDGLG
jgi:glucosamine--fructose-6-phosphate aminotransferase (isomerizing)